MSARMSTQWISVAAMGALAFVAVAIGKGGQSRGGLTEGDRSYLEDIETGGDHIGAVELAELLLARDERLALIDVRPLEEHSVFHLPGAVSLSVPQASGRPGLDLARTHELLVLYSNGPAHPGQAWVELRRQGVSNVRVLDGGLESFFAEVLTPASLRGVVTEEASKQEAASFALRQLFFGLQKLPPVAGVASDPSALISPTVVSTNWLRERLGHVQVLDVRASAADYATLHIPTATHLTEKSLRVRSTDRELFLLPAEELAARFGQLGLSAELPLVIYADERLQDATMVAMAFLAVGHEALAILEGGIAAWASAAHPLTSVVPASTPRPYVLRPPTDFSIELEELAQAVGAAKTQVLDVRSGEFFRGEKSTEARPGHIPGAINRPYSLDLDPQSGGRAWRDRATLLQEYQALGLEPEESIVVHCRTGHTASESFFVLRYLLGYKNVRWYNGSWTEWSARADLPAAVTDL